MDNWLRLLTWVVMDGTIVHKSAYNKRVQFKLSKQRKINVLRDLLDLMQLKYTFREAQKSGVNKLQPYYICLYGDEARKICKMLGDIKQFPSWFSDLSDISPVLDTIEITDGNRQFKNNFSWVSTDLHNVKLIEKICMKFKIPTKVKQPRYNKSGFKNGKLQYLTNIYTRGEPRREYS